MEQSEQFQTRKLKSLKLHFSSKTTCKKKLLIEFAFYLSMCFHCQLDHFQSGNFHEIVDNHHEPKFRFYYHTTSSKSRETKQSQLDKTKLQLTSLHSCNVNFMVFVLIQITLSTVVNCIPKYKYQIIVVCQRLHSIRSCMWMCLYPKLCNVA